MSTVTVSPKYQIVIPKEVRQSMGIVSGQAIQVIMHDNRIELVPIKDMKSMRGIVKGMHTDLEREQDRL